MPASDLLDESNVSLATVVPTRRQRRLAFVIVAALFATFAAIAPVALQPLPRLDSFVPVVQAIVTVAELMTAALLFGQLRVARSPALLVLASGYLFSGLLVLVHTLMFPGAFTAAGLLGAGPQSAAWLRLAWQVVLPGAVLGYVWLKDSETTAFETQTQLQRAILWGIVAVVVLVGALVLVVTVGHDWLPELVLTQTSFAPLASQLSGVTFVLALAALVLLWLRRRSVLDQWLLVAISALLAETAIIAFVAASRFTVAFYASRAFSVVLAGAVLVALLTEGARLYARLALTVRALERERVNKVTNIDVIVGTVAHEMKQPLTVIRTHTHIVQKLLQRPQPIVDEVQGSLGEIEAACLQVNQVVENVRALLRNHQEREPIDVNELVAGSVRRLRIELDIHGIGVEVESTPGLPSVFGHRGQLQGLLLNIIRNAIDAMDGVMDRPRTLRLLTTADRGNVVIAVEDTGVGIEARRLAYLFQAFMTTKARGTGLGLGICRMIVERHDGELTATSEVGRGSRFCITLPVRAEEPASVPSTPRSRGQATTSAVKVAT